MTTRAYDGTTTVSLVSSNYSLANIIGSDDVFLNIAVTGTLNDKNAGTAKNVTASGLGLLGTKAGNYSLVSTTATGAIGTVVQRQLSATLTGSVTKVYDQTNAAPIGSNNVTLGNFVSGEGAALATATATYVSPDVGTGIGVSLTFAANSLLANVGTSLSNYFLPGTTFANIGNITAKPLSASLVGIVSKIYDGNNIATLSPVNFQLSGFVGTDSATIGSSSGTYASINATAGISVTANATLVATGATILGNYLLPGSITGSVGTISQRPLTLALIGNVTKVYDGATGISVNSSNFSLSGFVTGEGATIGSQLGTLASANVGTGIVVTVVGNMQLVTPIGATLLSNYTAQPTIVGAIGQVNPRPLSASLIGTAQKSYDGNTSATLTSANFLLTGFVQGQGASVTRTAGIYDNKNAATFIGVQSTLTAADFAANQGTLLSNYTTPALATGAIGEITPRIVGVVFSGTTSKIYDGSTSVLVDPSQIQLTNIVDGESISVTRAPGQYATSNVGTGLNITIDSAFVEVVAGSNTILDNYARPSVVTKTGGIITARPVTVSLGGTISKIYDGKTDADLTSATLTLGNIIGSDIVTISRAATGTFNTADVGTRKRVTVAGLTLGGSGSSNYALTSQSVGADIGTISRRALTAILTGTTNKIYDGTTDAALVSTNFQIQNLVDGESLTVTPLTGTYAGKDVGTGLAITATLVSPNFNAGSATQLTNYILPTTASGIIGVITKRQLTATLNTFVSRVYDNSDSVTLNNGSISVSGFAGNESATINQPAATFASRNVGVGIAINAVLDAAAFNAASGTALSNYTLPTGLTGATGSIAVRPIAVALSGTTSKIYDGVTSAALTSANYTVNNVAPGDATPILNNPTSGNFATAGVGTSKTVTVSGLALVNPSGNYSLTATTADGTIGTITAATLTYVAAPVSRAQLVVNPILTGTVTGFVNNETRLTATSGGDPVFTTNADTASAQGSYAITGSGLTAANYTFVQAAANATALTVTAPPTSATADAVAVRPSAITAAVTVTPVVTPTPVAPPAAPAPAPAPASAPASSESGSPAPGSGDKPAEGSGPAPAAAPPAAATAPSAPAGATAPAAAPSGGDAAPAAPAPTSTKSAALPPPPPVEALPPSPVAAEKPPTPSDPADAGDPVLAAAGGGDLPPPTSGGGAATTMLAPGVSIETPSATRSLGISEVRFSETGDPSL